MMRIHEFAFIFTGEVTLTTKCHVELVTCPSIAWFLRIFVQSFALKVEVVCCCTPPDRTIIVNCHFTMWSTSAGSHLQLYLRLEAIVIIQVCWFVSWLFIGYVRGDFSRTVSPNFMKFGTVVQHLLQISLFTVESSRSKPPYLKSSSHCRSFKDKMFAYAIMVRKLVLLTRQYKWLNSVLLCC